MVSLNPDMSDAVKYPALQSYEKRSNSYYYFYYADLKGLQTNTIYYFTLHETRPHGDISSSVKQFKTYKYRPQYPYIILSNSLQTGNAGFFYDYAESDEGETAVSAYSNNDAYSLNTKLRGDAYIYAYKPYNGSSTSHKNVYVRYDAGFFSWGRTDNLMSPDEVAKVNIQMSEPIRPYTVQLQVQARARTEVTSTRRITGLALANPSDSEKKLIVSQGTCDLSASPVTIKPVEDSYTTWPMKFPGLALNNPKTEPAACSSMIPVTFGTDDQLLLQVTFNSGAKLQVESPLFKPGTEKWENGYTYEYPVTIYYTNESVEISVGDVNVTPWQQGSDDIIDIFDKN
jgi:hypothetical protein